MKQLEKTTMYNVIIKNPRIKGYQLYTLFYRYFIQSCYPCKISKYSRGIHVEFMVPFDVQKFQKLFSQTACLNVQTIWYKDGICTLRVS